MGLRTFGGLCAGLGAAGYGDVPVLKECDPIIQSAESAGGLRCEFLQMHVLVDRIARHHQPQGGPLVLPVVEDVLIFLRGPPGPPLHFAVLLELSRECALPGVFPQLAAGGDGHSALAHDVIGGENRLANAILNGLRQPGDSYLPAAAALTDINVYLHQAPPLRGVFSNCAVMVSTITPANTSAISPAWARIASRTLPLLLVFTWIVTFTPPTFT